MRLSLPLMAIGALALYSLTRPRAGTAEAGINVLQEFTQNPNIVIKPVSVPVVAVSGQPTSSSEVPDNIFQITEDVRIEGFTSPIANIPAGALVTSNDLAWISTLAADSASQAAGAAEVQASSASESAYYASAASAVPSSSGGDFPQWVFNKTNYGDKRLMTESLYQEGKALFSSVSMTSIVNYMNSHAFHYDTRNWILGHAVQAGAVNGNAVYRWA